MYTTRHIKVVSFGISHVRLVSSEDFDISNPNQILNRFSRSKKRASKLWHVSYCYENGDLPAHTKSAFKEYDILTVHGSITKNALSMMHKLRNMPSTVPESITKLFPDNMLTYLSNYEEYASWLSTYNKPHFRSSVFCKYNGHTLAITDQNMQITSRAFSQ